MRRRALTSLAFLAAIASAEELLEGKPVAYWVEQLEDTRIDKVLGEADRVFREAGPKAAAAVPGLVALFDHENRMVRFRAYSATRHIGGPALPALRKVLQGGSDRAALCAAAALEIMGPAAAPAIPELVSAAKTRSGEARGVAAATLGRLGAQDARDAVRAVLADEHPMNRARAAEALCRLGEPADRSIAVLCAVVALDAAAAAAFAAGALGRIDPDHPAALPALLGALDSKERRVRVQAARALAGCDSEAAIVALLSRDSAGDVLKRLGRTAGPALVAALAHEDAAIRAAAAQWVHRAGSSRPEVVSALTALLRDDDASVVRSATRALAQAGSAAEPAIPALLRNLRHRDPEVVRETAVTLGRIGKATPQVLRALRRLARDDEHGATAREALARLEGKR